MVCHSFLLQAVVIIAPMHGGVVCKQVSVTGEDPLWYNWSTAPKDNIH